MKPLQYPSMRPSPRKLLGFTLIELMVTLSLFSLLLMLAVPSYSQWVRNNQIRSAAESLQNGLRAAKGRATNLNRQVVFTTTNAAPGGDAAAVDGGLNWSLQFVPFTADVAGTPVASRFLEGGTFASGVNGITITGGPSTLCFNSLGRLVANAAPSATLPACTLPVPPATHTYVVSRTGAVTGKDRKLHVTVSIGGQVRMCDPDKLTTAPDGCPP